MINVNTVYLFSFTNNQIKLFLQRGLYLGNKFKNKQLTNKP